MSSIPRGAAAKFAYNASALAGFISSKIKPVTETRVSVKKSGTEYTYDVEVPTINGAPVAELDINRIKRWSDNGGGATKKAAEATLENVGLTLRQFNNYCKKIGDDAVLYDRRTV